MNGGVSTVLNVRSGAIHLALPASDVTEVFKDPPVTRVPNAPAALLGVASLRGTVVPVLSLAGLLGQPGAADATSRVILVESGRVGLLVDEIASLSTRTLADTENAPRAGCLYIEGDQATRIVNLQQLIDAQFSAIARHHAKPTRATAPAIPRPPIDEIAILCFSLANQKYALPLEAVSEVMALPSQIAPLPQIDSVSLGVTTLRDRVLPLILLRAILGLAVEHAPSQRVVVVKIDDSLIGLVVDDLAAVLRAPRSAISPVPAVLNRGGGEARIDSIYRMNDANGLVAILSAKDLFDDQRFAQIVADGRQKGANMTAESQHASPEQFVLFNLGREEYGLPIAAVDEIVRLPDALTRLPRAPAFVKGVMNLRGKIVPIIDERTRLSVASGGSAGNQRVIVVTIGDLQAGFVVDGVSQVLSLPPEQVEPAPDLRSEGARMFSRIAKLDVNGRMILLIDPRELLDRAERELLSNVVTAQSDIPVS